MPESLDGLRAEIDELSASRKRLVLCADEDRCRIERELHDSIQQDLVALAVNLQHARRLVDEDSDAAKALLDEMRRDVQAALDGTRALAHRLSPPLLDAGSLAAALRIAAAAAGAHARVEVAAGTDWSPELVRAVYFSCAEALESFGTDVAATVTVREDGGAVVFEIVADETLDPTRLRDRVEALGGQLRTDGATRVRGSLPLAR